MKKLGKKFSYLTKIFLVIGLLFSNLSGLSVVFAYEVTDNFSLSVGDNQITVKYSQELDENDDISMNVIENYTYLDGSTYGENKKELPVKGSELLVNDGYVFDSQILDFILFDGLYELTVSLYNETQGVDLGTVNYSSNITHDSGLEITIYEDDVQVEPVDGVYNVLGDVLVSAKILAGGIAPNDKFSFEEEIDGINETVVLSASELLNYEFTTVRLFNGILFGEYTDTLEVTVSRNDVLETYDTDINYMYGEYSLNADVFNEILKSYDEVKGTDLSERYLFTSNGADGVLKVYPDIDKYYSITELIYFMDLATYNSDVEYAITNDSVGDLLMVYEEYVKSLPEGEVAESIYEYYMTTPVDSSLVISVFNEGLGITFSTVLLGDNNDDLILDENDLQELMDQVVGNSDKDLLVGDLNQDEEIDVLDVLNLYQVYQNGLWEFALETVDKEFSPFLTVNETDITSEDEFTVDFAIEITDDMVNALVGEFTYDNALLQLVDVNTSLSAIGSVHDGKFIYVLDEGLADAGSIVVLTATFRALESGSANISLEELRLFNNNIEYLFDTSLETTVVINKSNDNTLSSLTVSGMNIALVDGTMDYQITVDNSNTSSLVSAITNNQTASIYSIVAPEELAVGENKIVITVIAENGDELIYTVTVIREEAKEESTTTNMNYQTPSDNTSTSVVDETPSDETVNIDDTDEDSDDEVIEQEEEEGNLSRVIIIILILLVIAGLIYLIFKDDDDEETKVTNREINKMKKNNDIVNNKKEVNNKKNNRK